MQKPDIIAKQFVATKRKIREAETLLHEMTLQLNGSIELLADSHENTAFYQTRCRELAAEVEELTQCLAFLTLFAHSRGATNEEIRQFIREHGQKTNEQGVQ